MAFYKIKSGRVNGVRDATEYVGTFGQVFYDDEDNLLRISDGVTPGGNPAFIPTATSSTVGGIKLGPGIVLNSEGQILIDSEGLEFSFGDFQGIVGTYTDSTAYALLSSINADEDVVIASNGTGAVKVVGQFDVYKTNGTVTGSLEDAEPFFRIKDDGQIRMLVPAADTAEGALEIVGNTSGIAHPPNQSGVIIHVTGNSPIDGVGQPCRNYFDSRDSYTVITGRRYNGPSTAVTKVLNGQTLLRLVGQASTDTGFQTFGPARVDFVATQDQAVGAQGGEVQIYATANNTTATNAVKVASFNGTTGVTATRFVGPLEGNVIATTVTATTLIGQLSPSSQVGITTVGTLTNVSVSGTIRYDITQNNGTATQLTSKSTPVTCNGRTGQITTHNETLAKGSAVTFTVNNTAVTAVTDVVVASIQNGASANSYSISVTRTQVNSFAITLVNNGTGPLAETLIINFAIIKVN
jgi:hypothetical protein